MYNPNGASKIYAGPADPTPPQGGGLVARTLTTHQDLSDA
jgi:hypothetical protein